MQREEVWMDQVPESYSKFHPWFTWSLHVNHAILGPMDVGGTLPQTRAHALHFLLQKELNINVLHLRCLKWELHFKHRNVGSWLWTESSMRKLFEGGWSFRRGSCAWGKPVAGERLQEFTASPHSQFTPAFPVGAEIWLLSLLSLSPCLAHHHGLLAFWKESQEKLFFKLLLVAVVYHSGRKWLTQH